MLLCMCMYKCHVYHLNKHSESAELYKQIKKHDAKSNMNKPSTSHQSELNKDQNIRKSIPDKPWTKF